MLWFKYLIAVLVLAVYVWMIVFAFKGGNMTIGFMMVGLFWILTSILAYKSGLLDAEFAAANQSFVDTPVLDIINGVFHDGIRSAGAQTVDIIVGAWFGTVLMETGIATTLIRKTVEFGGDKAVVVAVLLSIVVSVLFTSIFGIGAVIAIGVIVLPILQSLGISKLSATISYLFSVGAGVYLNPTLANGSLANYGYGLDFKTYSQTWGLYAMIIATVYVAIFTIVDAAKDTKVKAWAAPTDEVATEDKNVPGIALIIPLLPTPTIIFTGLQVIPTMFVFGFLALAICGYVKNLNGTADILTKTLIKGTCDTASLICFLIMLTCVSKSIAYVQPFIKLVLEPVIPKNPMILCIAVAVLAPAALFRGPLTLFGTAGPIFHMIVGLGYSTNFLFPLFWIPSLSVNISACVTQSYVAWGIAYSNISPKEYLAKSVFRGWILTAILCAVCYVLLGGVALGA